MGPVKIDWSNPLTRDMVALHLFQNNNDITNRVSEISNYTAKATATNLSGSVMGQVLECNGTANAGFYGQTLSPSNWADGQPFTLVGLIKVNSFTVQDFFLQVSTGARHSTLRLSAAGRIYFKIDGTGTDVEFATNPADTIVSNWDWVLVAGVAAASGSNLYVRSFSQGTGNKNFADSSNAYTGGGFGTLISSGGAATTSTFTSSDVSIAYTFVSKTALSAEQFDSLFADPYQFLVPA
jgi:hypothetical protein